MRALLLGLLILILAPAAKSGQEGPYNAGFLALSVPADPPVPVAVWYPTRGAETTWRSGFFEITAARDAPVAQGRFPLIVLSHGSGADEFHHRDWAVYLARHGFIVATIRHVGDSLENASGRGSDIQLTGRLWQVRQALDAVLADPRLANSIDAERIGMIGYSAGGYTTLATVGGRPDYGLWSVHCKAHPEDDELCPADGSWVPPRISRPGWALPPPDARVKAAVVMAPAGILFDAKGLAGIAVPLRVYRAADDRLVRNIWNADHVAALLSNRPEIKTVPGDHFVFLAPCPAELAAKYPQACEDAVGVDRAAIHRQIAAELVDFFARTLGPAGQPRKL